MLKLFIIIIYLLSAFTFGIVIQKTHSLSEVLFMSAVWPVAAAYSAAVELNRMHLLKGKER